MTKRGARGGWIEVSIRTDGEWHPVTGTVPHGRSSTFVSELPDGSRETLTFGWRQGQGPAVWFCPEGSDPDGEPHWDLRSGDFEHDVLIPANHHPVPARLHYHDE